MQRADASGMTPASEPQQSSTDLSLTAFAGWHAARSEEASEVPDGPEPKAPATDYRTFQRIGIQTSLISAVARLSIFFGIALKQGSPVSIRYFFDLIPCPTVEIDPAGFASLTSRSTLFTTIVMLALFIGTSLRHTSRDQRLAGRFMGIVGCVEMLGVDTARHLLDPPKIVHSTALWTLWPIAIGFVVLAVVGRHPKYSVKRAASLCLEAATLDQDT